MASVPQVKIDDMASEILYSGRWILGGTADEYLSCVFPLASDVSTTALSPIGQLTGHRTTDPRSRTSSKVSPHECYRSTRRRILPRNVRKCRRLNPGILLRWPYSCDVLQLGRLPASNQNRAKDVNPLAREPTLRICEPPGRRAHPHSDGYRCHGGPLDDILVRLHPVSIIS